VELIAAALDGYALDLWYDKREIKVGDSIVEKINDGLSNATHLIVILPAVAVGKPWVKRELSSSLMRQLGNRSIKLLPVLREDCVLPPLLADIKYADFRRDFDKGFGDMLESLRS
jgi:TIR domain